MLLAELTVLLWVWSSKGPAMVEAFPSMVACEAEILVKQLDRELWWCDPRREA